MEVNNSSSSALYNYNDHDAPPDPYLESSYHYVGDGSKSFTPEVLPRYLREVSSSSGGSFAS